MSEAKGQHEPSMEEILASIRRIIAEDGEAPEPAAASQPAAKPAPAAAASSPAASEPVAKPASEPAHDDILELTEMVEPDGSVVNVNEPVVEAEPPPRVAARPQPLPEPEPEPEEISAEAPIVSPATAAASVAALSRITELSPSDAHDHDIPLGAGHLTLEMLVRAELRPILRDWLDANLPGIVERIVRSEIARLVQGVPKR